jgi:drug/metabolite transporter (DMT)-like permease
MMNPPLRGEDPAPASHDATGRMRAPWSGALALLSAALFGASTPLAKLLLDHADPLLLAGLLYLGSGVGLTLLEGARRLHRPALTAEAALRGVQWVWLGLAIACGGIAAPALLMYGLAGTSAAAAALLLNLEPLCTVLLAWLVFGEAVGARVGVGMVAIGAGALVLTWPGADATGTVGAIAAVGAACLGWALDNNVTRKVSLTDPVRIAALKGWVAAVVNITAALARGAALPTASTVVGAAAVGALGYGLSLVLFVRALRDLGAARTGAYFSLAPFFGAALAVLVLADPLSAPLIVAGLSMAVGVWLHLTEHHAHEHAHAEMTHAHAHVHDEHHQHTHRESDPAGEPHAHAHRHPALRHRHPHFPDIHHRHRH